MHEKEVTVIYKENGNKRHRGFIIGDEDDEIIEWLCEFLGSNRSDVVRTATRAMAMQLVAMGLPGKKEPPEHLPQRTKQGRPRGS